MQRRGAALGIARWSARHPWRAIAGWLVFVVLCLVSRFGCRHPSARGNADTGSGQSGRADKVVAAAGYPTEITENVLVQPQHGRDDAEVSAAVAQLRTSLGGLSAVRTVEDPQTSADGRTQLLPVIMQDGGLANDAAVSWAADRVPQLQAAVATGGRRSTRRCASRRSVTPRSRPRSDARSATTSVRRGCSACRSRWSSWSIAFGALIAAGVPVLLALSAVASAMGLSALTSHLVPNSDAHLLGDPADRDGGRRRLLAVLPPPRARGAGRRAYVPRRRRDRRSDLRSCRRRLRRRRDDRDERDVPLGQRGVRVARRRDDARRRGGRHRLAHGAARGARQARAPGRPAAGAAGPPAAQQGRAWPRVAGDPAGRPRQAGWSRSSSASP